MLEVTNRCNLSCIHCGSSSGRARPGEMGGDLAAVIGDIAALGCTTVTLLGGEILLCREWETLANRVRDLGMDLIVVTNGLLVDDAVAARLASLAPSTVGVSIDGATAETYRAVRGADGLDASLAALSRLADAGLGALTAITCFHRLNLRDFDRFVDLFSGKPLTWQVQIAGKAGRFPADLFVTLEDYRWLWERILSAKEAGDVRLATMDDIGYFPLLPAPPSMASWPGCQAGISVLGIRSNGDVLPCLSLGDDFVVANLRERALAGIWADDALFERFRDKTRHLSGACAACDVRESCRGGCTEMAWSATGSVGCDPYCIRAIERSRLVSKVLR